MTRKEARESKKDIDKDKEAKKQSKKEAKKAPKKAKKTNVVGVTFYKDRFVLYKEGKKPIIDETFFTADTLKEVWTKKIKELGLAKSEFVISLEEGNVGFSPFACFTDLSKSKKFDKLLIADICKKSSLNIKEDFISYKYYKDVLIYGKIIVSYAHVKLEYINSFLDLLGNVDIIGVDIRPEGVQRVLGLEGDYVILHSYIEEEKERLGLYVYRNDFIMAHRMLNLDDFTAIDLKEEVYRTVDFIKNTVKDLNIFKWVILSEINGFKEAISEHFQGINFEVLNEIDSKTYNSKGLCMWSDSK